MSDDVAAATAFGLLADETRVAVLRAVAEAQSEQGIEAAGPGALRFSEIYERVDVSGTSKLSYHLEKLTGTFLRKEGDTYAFTHAGERLVRFILSGNYASPPDVDPVSVAGTCLHCGGKDLMAAIDEQFFLVRCGDCERPVTAYHVAPAQASGAAGEELIDRAVQRQTAELEMVRRGTCPDCFGPLESDVRAVPDAVDEDVFAFVALWECSACLRRISNPLPLAVAYHPASVAFHWEAGLDVTTTPVWELAGRLRDGRWSAERTAVDPAEYEITYRRDDGALRFSLDATGSVTATERVRRRGGAGE